MAVKSVIAIGEKKKYTGAMASTDTKSLSRLIEIRNGPEGPPNQQANKF
jgi:hypothetical protein